jgi:uncharacterized protein
MNSLERVRATSAALKIFPLPSVVLFPETVQPLHIFEPRYREMVKTALETDKVLALAQLQPGWEPDYHGRPPLKPMACAGLIAWHEQLPDGRYNIVVQGVTRVRVLKELDPRHGYREVMVDLLPDAPQEGVDQEHLRQSVLELASRAPQEATAELVQVAARAPSGGALADVVASMVVEDTDERQALLEELDVRRRARRVLDAVGELIARLGAERRDGPLN